MARASSRPWWMPNWTPDAGLHLLAERKIDATVADDGTFVVQARTAGPMSGNGFLTRYEWRPVAGDDTAVDLIVHIDPNGRWPQDVERLKKEGQWPRTLARLGLLLAIEEPRASDAQVDWVGLGPDESYADSALAAVGGAYSHTVDEWQTRYTHPQENGARRGVNRTSVTFNDGSGLRIESGEVTIGGRPQPGFELSLRPWSDQQLDSARHPQDLVPDGRLWIHIDAAQHGVGSAACGPGVLPNAQLHNSPVRMNIRFTSTGTQPAERDAE